MKDLIIGTVLIVIAIMVVGYSLSQYDKRTAWYLDADGDSYGNPLQLKKAERLPPGYVDNDLDCNDNSSVINKDQTAWYTNSYKNNAEEESFDYNCDGKEELRFNEYANCETESGWQLSSIPTCGEKGLWLTKCSPIENSQDLQRTAISKTQECR